MSPVSHDATWMRHHGITNGENPGENKTDYLQRGQNAHNIPEKNKTVNIELSNEIERENIAGNLHEKTIEKKKPENILQKGEIAELLSISENKKPDDIKLWKGINLKGRDENLDEKTCRANVSVPGNSKTNNNIFKKKSPVKRHWKKHFVKRTLEKKIRFENVSRNKRLNNADTAVVERHVAKQKTWERLHGEDPLWINVNAGNAVVKRTKEKRRRSKWSLNYGVLISLVMLNVTGLSSAVDNSGFSSTLTSRMIATFLGYPTTCSLGAEVRPCTLTLTCWLRGGTRLRGCGGWLFSCCGSPEPSRDGFDNSIPSSDWKYKMSPPKLMQVPQRNVMPNNVFRRRVDDDISQMDCGLPSSRILQKRIIGGREARFAEFPWQAHVRISEFQCGGVLVSRWFVATAAHCVSRAPTRDIAVWLGAIDTSATYHPARKIGVVQKILHPLFQFRMTQPDRYDIALLKLSRPITYMSHILPICLPDYDMELRGRSGVIAGWGKTDASNSHTGTNLLRSATVPILSKEQCINWHQSKQISVEIHSEMICAGHSDGHQDACLGDSGGPLIVLDNGRYFLVGITSAGFGCGVDHQPGIYHNVKVTANWIRGVITPSVNYIDV